MIDEQTMRELGRVEPTVANRSVMDVVAGGRRLRRRRQAKLGTSGALAILVVVGGLTQLPKDRPLTAGSRPGPPEMPVACVGRPSEERGPDAADGLRFLPSWLPAGTEITMTRARVLLRGEPSPLRCVDYSTALVLGEFNDQDPAEIERSVILVGPAPARFNTSDDNQNYEPVELRGTEGTLLRLPTGQPSQLVWTEGNGTSWRLGADNMSAEHLIEIAKGLVLDPTGDTPASITVADEGLEVLYQRTTRAAPRPDEIPQWIVDAKREEDPEPEYSLEVTRTWRDEPVFPTAVGEERAVTVRGHPAVAGGTEESFAGYLVWNEAPDIRVELTGPNDLETLTRIAESLELVPSDDPRIKN